MSESSDSTWQPVARLEDVDPTFPHGVQLSDGTRVCLVRERESVFAVEDRCPHRDFALSGGDVVAPCVLECPWHGAQFDVRTGAVLRGPATDAIRTYEARVEDGVVYVGHPLQLDT
ncbi:MAG: Rieske 2Fe-2S domain-containing protein [Gemmatimonadaceae bacterium]|nr:Rieske 2Fe-2S domain-containing protein [Gemmatimonadaceae bacterium]